MELVSDPKKARVVNFLHKVNLLKAAAVLFCIGSIFFQIKPVHAAGWLTGWNYRKQITISNANISSTLSYFPLLVHIASDTTIGVGMADVVNGYDVRFTDSSGNTLLPYEREDFSDTSSSASGDFWVQVPDLASSTPTAIYIYYGNSSQTGSDWTAATSTITNCSSITNAQCVWKEGSSQTFTAVYHLGEKGTNPTAKDSTANLNNSTNQAWTPTSTGQVDGAGSFNGSSQYIIASSTSSATSTTVSAWFNAANGSVESRIYARGGTNGNNQSIEIDGATANNLRAIIGGNNDGGTNQVVGTEVPFTPNVWNYVVITFDGTNLKTYLNGVLSATNSASLTTLGTGNQPSYIGARQGGAHSNFSGSIDEVRTAFVARSTSWIKFSYCNMLSTATGTCSGVNELSFAGQESSVLSSNVSSTYENSTGNSVVITGFGTSWTSGTPGTPTFTISGGNGAAITAQTVTDSTHATLTITAGNSTGMLTITDPSSGETATINVLSDTANQITSFSFGSPSATGTINNSSDTIAVSLPYGTNVTNLVPTIAVSTGATISPASGVAENFTNPVVYSVTAEDGHTTQQYTVTATVPSTFSPSQIAGLQIWLEATQGLYEDVGKTQLATTTGDPIATWADQSGNGKDATATSSYPAVGSVCSTICQSVYFTGTSYFNSPWNILTGDAPRSIAMAFTISSGVSKTLLSWGSTTNGAMASIYVNAGGYLGFSGYNSDLYDTSQSYNDGGIHVLVATFDGATLQLFIDGALKATSTMTLNTGSSNLFIGERMDGTHQYVGNINELEIYNEALSSTDLNNLTTYLINKWKPILTPPSDLSAPVPIIIDTDISSDEDDTLGIAEANALTQEGEAKLLAVVTDADNNYSAPAVEVLNAWWGENTSTVPIGAYQGSTDGRSSSYTQQITNQFGASGDTRANYPSALTVYRQTLASAPNDSVVIISIGFLDNLRDLLQSPADSISPLTGMQLITQKVRRLAVMGGDYPNGTENNFDTDPAAASYVMDNWPTEIVVDGYTLGVTVETNPSTSRSTSTDPLAEIWNLGLGIGTPHSSWDPLNTLYGITGLSTNFTAVDISGINTVNSSTGANIWSCPGTGNVTVLGKAVSDATLGSTIDSIVNTVPIIISSISSGTPSQTSATITWTTMGTNTVTSGSWNSVGINTNSEVDYGVNSSYTASSSSPSMAGFHAITLSGLSPNTTYHYRVKSTYSDGSFTVSGDQTFTTAAANTGSGGVVIVASSGSGYLLPVGTASSTASGTLPISSSLPTSTAALQSLLASLEAELNDLLQQASAQGISIPGITSSSTYTFTRDLTLGSKGSDVAALQHYLNTHGFPVVSTPIYAGSLGYETQFFGQNTQAALARFQKAEGITPAIGYFGPVTRAYVNAHP